MQSLPDDAVRWFEDIRLADRPMVGGKGASLGELTAAGIRVPAGFVVTTAAFELALAEIDPGGTIRGQIERLSQSDLPAIAAAADAIRDRFLRAALPQPIAVAVSAAYLKLAGPASPVAVRSSATSEDSAEASFAGLQDTQLCVAGSDAVLAALAACWASLYSRESVSYRLRLKLPERQVAMGVVVQRMLASRASGVMFTRSPVSGDRSVIAIEGSFGLGSAIVSGEVTPDNYVVNKVTGDIVSRTLSVKALRHVSAAGGGVRIEALDASEQRLPALSDQEVRDLALLGKKVERHYGAAQDIEWAIAPDADGVERIHLLQSRPETVWSQRDTSPLVQPAARAYDHVLAALYKPGR
jgi:pyruvate,water dikinase